jgi:hypothetical protein
MTYRTPALLTDRSKLQTTDGLNDTQSPNVGERRLTRLIDFTIQIICRHGFDRQLSRFGDFKEC